MTNTNTIKNLKITPCTSPRTNEAVKNQYIIELNNIIAFQSYDSLIAIYDRKNHILTFGCDYDYSVTTIKYLNQFLYSYCYWFYSRLPSGKSLKDRLKKAIDSGLIQYDENMR